LDQSLQLVAALVVADQAVLWHMEAQAAVVVVVVVVERHRQLRVAALFNLWQQECLVHLDLDSVAEITAKAHRIRVQAAAAPAELAQTVDQVESLQAAVVEQVTLPEVRLLEQVVAQAEAAAHQTW
jgi:hypothetical protein